MNTHWQLGCVSYLNTKPLIHGLDAKPAIQTRLAPPSHLLEWLENGEVDIALCPVIDYQLSSQMLQIIPVGGIACGGETLTVRLFSRIPFDQITQVHVDADSHTSIRLMQVLLAEQYGSLVNIQSCQWPNEQDHPDSILLIGDKVVLHEPDRKEYPYQMDLGEAWAKKTGLPFVFAIWMGRSGQKYDNLVIQMREQLDDNIRQIDTVVEQYAIQMNWPDGLAKKYLKELLEYRIDDRHLKAIELFWKLCHRHGLISNYRPMIQASVHIESQD